MKLFALLTLIGSLALVGCQPATDTTTTPPADTNAAPTAPAAPADTNAPAAK